MEGGRSLVILDLSQLRNVTLDDPALMREVVDALVSDTSTAPGSELRQAVERGTSKLSQTGAQHTRRLR